MLNRMGRVLSVSTLVCVLLGCGGPSGSQVGEIVTEGVVDASLPKDVQTSQEWIRKLLHVAREDSVSTESLQFIAGGLTFQESEAEFLEGHAWLARWNFLPGATKDKVPVELFFTDKAYDWGDPTKHHRVERVYEVRSSGNRATIKRSIAP